MAESIAVLHICNEVGLGGTERGIVSMCRKMRYGIFEHTVLCLTSAGVRAGELAGVAQLHVLGYEQASLATWCGLKKFKVAIIHRAGAPDARWSEVLTALRSAGVAVVVEINIFGLIDTTPEDELIDWHLHISKSSYCNFREMAERSGYSRLDRHRVLYIPIETGRYVTSLEDRKARIEARARLNLCEDDFVLLRTGRPDFRKWGDLLMEAIPLVVKEIPKARFVFLSAPASRAWYMLRQPYAHRIRILPATSDDRRLRDAYASADVYVHSSRRGESFGASLVEAMAAGLPVVVNSTPWRDNAQVEVVDHMKTGIIANTPAAFASALVYLQANRDVINQMGKLAQEKAVGVFDAEITCHSLAKLLVTALQEKGLTETLPPFLAGDMQPSMREIEQYWLSERMHRSNDVWEGEIANRFSMPVRRAAWAMVDVCEWAGRRVGVLK